MLSRSLEVPIIHLGLETLGPWKYAKIQILQNKNLNIPVASPSQGECSDALSLSMLPLEVVNVVVTLETLVHPETLKFNFLQTKIWLFLQVC